MEDLKKRKLADAAGDGELSSEEQLRSLLDPLAKPQLVDLLAKLGFQYPSIAEEIKSVASADPVHRKLFVRGLAWNTTSETLCAAFRVHGEIEEGAVIHDKVTGKSRGYGFITYKHMDSTHSALKAPSKLIDGRLAVCNLACEGLSGSNSTPDLPQRKLYVGGLSPEVTSEMLLNFFGRHGEIEEGSVAYDKDTNESRGFGFVTYKTVEATKKAIDDPQKNLGGRTVIVKLADSHKGRIAQTQLPTTTMVPMNMPMSSGYPQPGKSHTATAPRYFDLRYNNTEQQYQLVRLGINRMAQDRYRDYKYQVHQHYKHSGADKPFKEVSGEDWQKCVDHFTSKKFVDRSKQNEVNRSKSKYNSSQGTKTFSASRYDLRNSETQEWPALIPSWKTFHTNKKGEWVNEAAAQEYARLEAELLSQTQEAASSGAEVDEHAVIRKVLGERRGHEKGVGRKLMDRRSGSTSSTAGSRASCAAGSLSYAPYNEELAALQAQLGAVQAQSDQYRQYAVMQQQFMNNLVAQLQAIMPNFQMVTPLPEFPNLNQPPISNPNPAGNYNEEEEDEELRND